LLAAPEQVRRASALRHLSPPSGWPSRGDTFTRLPDVPGAVQAIHIGLNNRGQTAASAAFLSADGTFVTLHAYRYDDGEPTRIAVPGAVSTFATAINDRGHIVGYYTDPAPATTRPAAAAANGAASVAAVGTRERIAGTVRCATPRRGPGEQTVRRRRACYAKPSSCIRA
jgi:hypothetical protein